jgi:Flp pilus assembly pilin Flp
LRIAVIESSFNVRLRRAVRRLCGDDRGQDLIEYALLTAFIGVAGAAAFSLLATTMGSTYGSWDAGNQDLWTPPPPAGAGS